MRKNFKRVLSYVLAVIMCISILPAGKIGMTANAAVIPSDAVEFNGHYYKVIESKASWKRAKQYCENLNGHLVTIENEDENKFVSDLMISSKIYPCWLGATDELSEGNFKWVTGENFAYTNWGSGEPNGNMWPREDYIQIFNDGLWNDCDNDTYANSNYGAWAKTKGYICEWDDSVLKISGYLTGSSTNPKIAIDDTWYEYDTSVPGLTEALDKFAIGDKITCKLDKYGKIVACSKTEISNAAISSVNVNGKSTVTLKSDTNKYDTDKISVGVEVINKISSKNGGAINTNYISGYDITFDKIVVKVSDKDLLYFKDGAFNLGKSNECEMKLKSPITIKAGQTNSTDGFEIFVNDNYKWNDSDLSKNVTITADIYNGDELISSDYQDITFKNEAAQESIKNNKESEEQSQIAADILNKSSVAIQNAFLSEIFTKDELKAIQNAIQCKIALSALPERIYKKANFSDKMIEKLMNKAGVTKEWFGTAYNADISLTVNVDTEKYGKLEIEFSMPTTYYSFGSDNPFGGTSFDFSYEVTGGKGKKNVPKDKLSADAIGLGTYANMQNFASSLQKVALAQLESAYNLGYGNDLNKAGEMLFGETFAKILSKTAAKSYSHLTFSMMTFPSKRVGIHCPVDVYLYDSEGTLCASVVDNGIVQTHEDIEIEVIGDEKYITIYDGDYSIEIISTAISEMDITIDEYSSTDEKIRSVNFDNIEFVPGESFVTTIDESYLQDDYLINRNAEEEISNDGDKIYLHCLERTETVIKAPTCTEAGEKRIGCANCDYFEIKSIPVISHDYTSEITLASTCTEEGTITYTCTGCGGTYTETIPTIGHADKNADGKCDTCGEIMDSVKNCSHNCHKGGFMGFIWKIINLFNKLFRSNQYCACGARHW